MYQIINVENGQVIGCVNEPNYIKLKQETGCFVPAKKPEDRAGVAFQSVAYNLSGTDGVGAPVTVVLSDFDAASFVGEVPGIKEAIAEIEDVLCEMDVSMGEISEIRNAVAGIEDALCEIDMGVNEE